MHKSIFALFLSLAAMMIWSSCKTADGRPTKLGMGYLNLTGRYNAYYHAGLRRDKAHETIRMQYKDNYNELIALYPYAANTDTNSIKPPLEEAIKKLAFNIELRRPSHWTDDSYLMLGEVEFLKKKYEKSTETFKYIVDKYNPDKPKSAMSKEEIAELNKKNKKANAKKKKKKKPAKKKPAKKKKKPSSKKKKKPTPKPTPKTTDVEPNGGGGEDDKDKEETVKPKKYGLFKHKPNRHHAMLWLAKSYIEIKQYDDAGLYLRLLDQDPNTPRRLRSEVKIVEAYLFIAQKEYSKAIEPLEAGIKLCRRRRIKSRYVYVLAQLYDRQNNAQLAYENYRRVIKLKPAYEMDLNARLSAAKAGARAGATDINPELAMRRMLRDEKNEEYKDQIYFALAEIQLRNGNTEDGIENLRNSLAASKGGPQRVEAAHLLASLYYEKKDYIPAYLYYDTTSQIMDKIDPRSTEVVARRRQLELFATNSIALTVHDSLLKISLLSPEEQKAYAQRIRKEQNDLAAAEAKASGGKTPASNRPLTMQEKANLGGKNTKNTTSPSATGGKPNVSDNALAQSNFALYNPAQQKRGEKDFEKRWGNRPWIDNWRSSKALDDNPAANVATGKTELQPMTEQEIKDFLTALNVPQDEKQRDELNKKIATNLLNIGTAQHEQLNQTDNAITTLQKLIDRYPKLVQGLEGMYLLFNIYNQKGDQAKADAVKKLIMTHHPDSDIAKAAQNPSFVNARQAKEKELNTYYQATYETVRKGKYEEAIAKINDVQKLFGENHQFRARFALLLAMCEGGTKGEQDYIKALRIVSTSFPNTEEDKKAKEIVALLTKNGGSKNTTPNKTDPTNPNKVDDNAFKFTENMATGHYVLIVFDDNKVKMDPLRTPVDNFNKSSYAESRLNVASLMIENSIPAITVRKFSNADQAIGYVKSARANAKYLGENPPTYTLYIVGQNNYRALLQPPFGKFEAYKNFHNQYYKLD
jgi:tetratricopeptide (TPR) repeat protein